MHSAAVWLLAMRVKHLHVVGAVHARSWVAVAIGAQSGTQLAACWRAFCSCLHDMTQGAVVMQGAGLLLLQPHSGGPAVPSALPEAGAHQQWTALRCRSQSWPDLLLSPYLLQPFDRVD